MLRVSNVSFESQSKSKLKINRSEANVNTYQASPIAYNTVPSGLCINTTAKSLIAFKGAGFDKTLEDNYFKLPKGCKPDKYQENAAVKLFYGKDVLVTAPTGTGKTAIAFYSISQNTKTGTEHMKEITDIIDKKIEEGGRTFYTTPLKALCSEKRRQLEEIYGKENVGILTGDEKDPNAAKKPIIVMTTEIYRNMVMGNKFKNHSPQLDNLKTVIFDELHYLGDADRGGVWEQSIILSDPKTQLLSLSATIGNAEDVNDWMSGVKGKHQTHIDVSPKDRYVPLVFTNEVLRVIKDKNGKAPISVGPGQDVPLDKKHYVEMVNRLDKNDQLPAIFFVFSKKVSKGLLKKFAEDGKTLTTQKERDVIQSTIDRYEKEGKYLGESLNIDALMKGYAIHNSGLLPSQKQLVEELFQKPSKDEPPYLKVIIATETLAAGINMPARTTVISSMSKPTSSGSAGLLSDGTKDPAANERNGFTRELTPNEFHQMAGRAGRRGIDKIGYVYTMPTSVEQMKKFAKIITAPPNALVSSFKPDFSFIAGYYRMTKDDDVINELMAKSLHAFDRSAVKSREKSQEMIKVFNQQKNILKNFGFIEKDNTLTEKGELLSMLNGYHQIPVIDVIHGKLLAGMNPVELAACVGSLANINEKPDEKNMLKFHKEPEFFEHEDEELKGFVADFDEDLSIYNEKRSDEYIIDDKGKRINTFHKIEQNKDVAKHLYAWADLNSKSDTPRDNWKELYKGDLAKSIRDEGSLFREITQTVDLLKQISTISGEALKITKSKSDEIYYKNLKSTIEESIELLKKEPVVDAE